MEILLANIVDPDQTPHYVASDLGLHCLPTLQVSQIRMVKIPWLFFFNFSLNFSKKVFFLHCTRLKVN